MKEFPGKAVLSMAARGGLLHGAVQQTEKNFFQRRAERGGGWAETLSLQGVQGSAAQRGAAEKFLRWFRSMGFFLRNGENYVTLIIKTFRAERGVGRWVRRSGGVVGFFAGGMAGFVRNGRKIKKRRAENRRGMGHT